MSDRDTTLTMAITGNMGVLAQPVILHAGKWTLVRAGSYAAAAAATDYITFYPVSTDAPVVRFARPYAQFVPDTQSSARLFNINAGPERKAQLLAAAPTTGTWKQGDIVFNTAPAASGKVGWVCVVAGAPGTWKPFGAIDP
jgi:hypothetical protein